jgi:hypothetical protein
MNHRTVTAITFWLIFGAAIALAPHHPWLRYGFALAIIFVLLASAAWYLVSVFRNPQRALTDHGYPRWFLRFAHDDQSKPMQLDSEKS